MYKRGKYAAIILTVLFFSIFLSYKTCFASDDDTEYLRKLISDTPVGNTITLEDNRIYIIKDEIQINRNIKIQGNSVIKASSDFPNDRNLIKITADNVEIRDITVDGNNENKYTAFSGNGDKLNNLLILKSDNVKIRNVKSINARLHGICFLGDSRNIEINSCIITNFSGCGIVGHWAFDDKSRPVSPVINNNTIQDALKDQHQNQSYGILLSAVEGAVVTNNRLKNTYSKPGDGGIMLYAGDIEVSISNGIVSGNEIDMELNIPSSAIRLEGRNISACANNIVTQNRINICKSTDITGIRAFANSTGNYFTNNIISGGRTGILIDTSSKNNYIYKNEIYNSGIQGIEARSPGTRIDSNTLVNVNSGNKGICGILLLNDTGLITCSNNYIAGNSKNKIKYGIHTSSIKNTKLTNNKVINYFKSVSNIK